MEVREVPFAHLLEKVVDNRGKTCPTADYGIPLIATNCIRNTSLYPNHEKIRYVSQETYDSWFRGHPKPGDLIFVTKGTPGRVCMVPDPIDFCIAQDMVAIRADRKTVDPRYLFAVLRSQEVQRRIENMHVGTLIPHFKKGDFDKLFLPIPERKVQEFIGEIYFILSYKIELNQQMNRTLEGIAHALFKSWFIDFDPVRANLDGRQPYGMDAETAALFPESFEDSPLGQIPKGWKIVELGQVLNIYDSKRIPLSKKQRAGRAGNFPYYGAASVMDYVDDYLFDGIYVLVGEDGSVIDDAGHPMIQYAWGQFWVNNHAHVLQGAKGVSTEHLMLFLRQVNILPYITGAVQLKLNQNNMKRITFTFASYELNEAFASQICPLFEKIRENCDENLSLALIRDALLPKLLSGKVRIEGAKQALEAAIV